MSESGFVEPDQPASPSGYTIEPLTHVGGSTCMLSLVRHEGRRLLLKRLRPELAGNHRYVELLVKEYETGRRLHHPHLVEYLRMGSDEQGSYLIMEYVDGDTLEHRLEQDPAYFDDPQHILRLFSQLLSCLSYLHAHQVLHLDLKPDNILLTRVSDDVKVIDLGFCYSDSYDCTMGRNGQFSAPEQLQGQASRIDASTDLYAVGRLLQWAYQHRHCPRLVQRVIARALHPDPAHRYSSADEMRRALVGVIEVKSRIRRHTLRLGAFASLPLLLGLLHFIFSPRHAEASSDHLVQMNYAYTILSHDSLTCCIDSLVRIPALTNIEQRVLFSPIKVQGRHYRAIEVRDSIFHSDTVIETLSIPEGVEIFGASACFACSHLRTVSFPTTLRYIENNAFADCPELTDVIFPEHLEHIGHNAFVGAKSIRHLTIPQGIRLLPLDCFVSSGLQSITLPDSLQILERGVFYNCHHLRSITLPATLQRIGDFCFYRCDSLTEVRVLSPVPIPITHVFPVPDSLHHRILYVPSSGLDLYRQAPHWRDFAEIRPL